MTDCFFIKYDYPSVTAQVDCIGMNIEEVAIETKNKKK